jgi:hypothetical protein
MIFIPLNLPIIDIPLGFMIQERQRSKQLPIMGHADNNTRIRIERLQRVNALFRERWKRISILFLAGDLIEGRGPCGGVEVTVFFVKWVILSEDGTGAVIWEVGVEI